MSYITLVIDDVLNSLVMIPYEPNIPPLESLTHLLPSLVGSWSRMRHHCRRECCYLREPQ